MKVGQTSLAPTGTIRQHVKGISRLWTSQRLYFFANSLLKDTVYWFFLFLMINIQFFTELQFNKIQKLNLFSGMNAYIAWVRCFRFYLTY